MTGTVLMPDVRLKDAVIRPLEFDPARDDRDAAAAAKGLPDTSADLVPLATCPLCHTAHASLTLQMLYAGGGWRCLRCATEGFRVILPLGYWSDWMK